MKKKDFIEKEITIGNSTLKEIWISDRYVLVRDGFFNGDSSISSIIVPNPVKRICNGAFACCEELTSVSLPDSLCSIGHCAFRNCRKLESITIPRNVTEIASSAFVGCWNLSSVTILTSFLPEFRYCKFITSITIGENLLDFNPEAFAGCKHIKTIVVDENNSHFDSRNNCNAIIETGSGTLLLACNSTKIPEGIKHISGRAFSYCGRIKKLSLPNSLETIEGLPENVTKIIVPKGRKQEFKKKLPRTRGIELIEK